MSNDVVMLIIAFVIATVFVVAFFVFMYALVRGMRKTDQVRNAATTEKPTKEELDTVITLTPDERRSMMRSTVAVALLGTLLCGMTIVVMSMRYWQYAVEGERISATVTNVSKTRSGSRRKRTKYTYTLQATVNGNVVRDTYGAGSYHAAKVKDVVDVYATKETPPQLALAAVEDRDPLLVLLVTAVLGFILLAMKKQRAMIATGRMKLRQFSEKSRKRKLMELRAGSHNPSTPIENNVTADGKPTYTIGSEADQPTAGNDGRDYRTPGADGR